jgi:DNA end-binding protein Ku
MATRSIASLTISFGLVSIPVKLYIATESSAAIRFKLMGRSGFHVRQQYVPDVAAGAMAPAGGAMAHGDGDDDDALEDDAIAAIARGSARAAALQPAASRTSGHLSLVAAQRAADVDAAATTRPAATPEGDDVDADDADDLATPAAWPPPDAPIARQQLVKGYEFAKGQYVLFTEAELAALRGASRQTIDIVAFMPEGAVDPVYIDKAYYLAPDRRGHKPYALLLQALRASGRAALARWAWRGKEYVVQIRATERVLVLHQLLYADEVRSPEQLSFDLVPVTDAELRLALQLIEQNAVEAYDPTQFVDEEKQRILQAVERKIAGNRIVAPARADAGSTTAASGEVIDLIAALQGSLRGKALGGAPAARSKATKATAPADTANAAARATPRRAKAATAGAGVVPSAERKPAARVTRSAEPARAPARKRT